MQKNKTIIFLIICMLTFSVSWSQTVEIQGKIEGSEDVENIHIINKTLQKFTITDVKGEFNILAKVTDTLVVSSIQNKLKTLVVTIEDVLSKKITITLEENINELDEVVLGKFLTGDLIQDVSTVEGKPITAMSLGIPSYQGPLKKPRERALSYAQSGTINIIVNTLNGKIKRLKKFVKLKDKEALMYKIKTKFSKDLFEENPLPENKIMEYFYFVSDAENFKETCTNKSDLEILVFLKERLVTYKSIIKTQEN